MDDQLDGRARLLVRSVISIRFTVIWQTERRYCSATNVFFREGGTVKIASLVLCMIACNPCSVLLADETAEGKVTRILDGDSILVTDSKLEEFEVQLEGIDAPELKQQFGKESTEGLSKLLKDKAVRLTWKSRDNFERPLAQVYVGEKHINLEMIKTGMAWHFKKYNQDEVLAKAEVEANEAKKGLWAKESPTAPWDYRRDNKAPDKPFKK